MAPLERPGVGVAEAVDVEIAGVVVVEVADVLPELVDVLALVVEVCVAAMKSAKSEL